MDRQTLEIGFISSEVELFIWEPFYISFCKFRAQKQEE